MAETQLQVLMKWGALAAAAPFILGAEGVALLTPAAAAITSSTAFASARADVLKALTSGAVVKKILGSAVAVMGTATFVNFISEEALQTAGMACFVAKGAQDPVALRKALDNYEALYAEAKKQAGLTTWLSPFTKAQFDSNLAAVASAIDAYEAALSNMKKTQSAALASRWAKDKVASLKATNAVYEKNALEAMNAGELALGGQWLEKIADASAREKARGRVVKAASKTWKAAVAAALKAADVAEAWRVLAFIPDAVVKASMQGKITDFEVNVEVKLQKAQESAARKAVVAQNKASQSATRTAYFASVPEAQRPAWYAEAAAKAGAPGGAAEMAQGTVYWSKATGQYTVSTASGLVKTSSAAQAAAVAQAAGGKATAAGLAAGHPV
jgi:hypothetical protein